MKLQILTRIVASLSVWALSVLFGVTSCAGTAVQAEEVTMKITGTYSSLQYIPEAGDLLGYEVHVVYTKTGYKAAIQVADGGAGDIFIVEVRANGDTLSFDVPDTIAGGIQGHFVGQVSADGLDGVITYTAESKVHVFLKRTKSYWD